MDVSELKIFEAVARLGGMNRAAGELNTVQSNVTARIKQLEERLDVVLFERSSRGVVVTPAGERLLPYARKMIELVEDASVAARDEGTPQGPLKIGSLETTTAMHLAPLLSKYVAAFPAVDLSLRTGTTCELVEMVLSREVDGAFVCGPVDHPDLESEVVFTESLALLTAPNVKSIDHMLRSKDVRIVVLRSGCSYRQMLEGWLAKRGIVGLRQLEFGTFEAIIACVSAGLGITFLPERMAAGVEREGRVKLHPLHEDGIVKTEFIRRKDAHTSSALIEFLRMARPHIADVQAAE